MDTTPEAPLVVAVSDRAGRRPATPSTDTELGVLGVGAMTVAMAAIGAFLLHLQLHDGPDSTPRRLAALTLVAAFAVAELVAIELPTPRGAQRHSFRELPAIVGLIFLSPVLYVVASVVGGGIGSWLRAERGSKLAFRLAVFLVEAALGMLLYRMVLGGGDALGPRGWSAVFLAILLTNVVALAAMAAASSLIDGHLDREAVTDVAGYGIPAAMAKTCVALLCIVLVVHEPAALPLLCVVLVVLAGAYRGYVALARGHAQLRLLHRFIEAAARAVDVDDGVETLLRNSCELLGAERAEFVVLPVGRRLGSRTSLDARGVVTRAPFPGPEQDRDAWWAAASLGEAVLRPYDSGHLDLSTGATPLLRGGMAIPLQRDRLVEAVLLVMDRRSEPTFTARDQRMLETLAGHAAVALDTARLVERLEAVATQRMYEARHDVLTGLPNRRAFEEAVGAASARAGAVLLIDLDDFKDINDTLGHRAGDALLCEIGERVQFASGGTVARLGGDEFAVVVSDVGEEEARAHARELLAVISRPVTLDDVSLLVSASVGIALMPNHGRETSELLQHADVAMYVAKDRGSRVEVYRVDDGELSERRLVLAADLEAAIDRRHVRGVLPTAGRCSQRASRRVRGVAPVVSPDLRQRPSAGGRRARRANRFAQATHQRCARRGPAPACRVGGVGPLRQRVGERHADRPVRQRPPRDRAGTADGHRDAGGRSHARDHRDGRHE